MESMSFSAKTLDEAITKACVELGVTSESIEYEITETGSNGIFGIGARPYVISVRLKEEKPEITIEAKPEAKALSETRTEIKKEAKKSESKQSKAEVKERIKPRTDIKKKAAFSESRTDEGKVEEKAMEFLSSIFEGMKMNVDIKAELSEDGSELDIELSGDDMGVLIGKRGQTLDAIQYLTGQVINKHRDSYIRVKIDTENYRERRRETLEKLAKNISGKVKRTKRPVALEPMNPYERRIIHSVLQSDKDVFTRSEGEEPYRHVVVCYQKKKK